ncbi:MAG: D-cysteine desulfhydrase [Pseudomonadota bacterium]
MDLTAFPRVSLAHLPTPIEPLPRLTEALGGPQILVKRDDCTGLSTGGNKTRKLEYLIGAALAEGADMVITHGATQSNHVRQTAAAAAKHRLKCHVLLENRIGSNDPEYLYNGNVLFAEMHGATTEHVAPQPDMNAALAETGERLRSEGHKVYVIPGGGSSPTGALGYVRAALELTNQMAEQDIKCRHMFAGSGSAGTHAGLIAGLTAVSSEIAVHGVCVRTPSEKQDKNVLALANRTVETLNVADVDPARIETDDEHIGEGYGIPGPDTLEAIDMLARLDGILLDPVYTGKVMAGLIKQVRAGRFDKGETVLFLHTGGAAALPAYAGAVRPQTSPAA